MQMDGDMKKMQAAFGYRTQEADQQQRFRGVNAHQDSDLKMREADQAFGFSTRRADQDSGLRMREADQSHLHRSREGEQQFNFSRTLQRDNNDVREKMQQAGFTQDRDMTNLRDRLEGERTQRQALRASQSFRGRF
jgi:predicted DsbA family dithiol-disulfide isomerase